jgi:uncharacterized protein
MKKAEITYPCEWSFRVIGKDKEHLAGDIKKIMSDRMYRMEESNRNGKYVSLNLKLTVDSKQERNLIFAALKSSANVTMVL